MPRFVGFLPIKPTNLVISEEYQCDGDDDDKDDDDGMGKKPTNLVV